MNPSLACCLTVPCCATGTCRPASLSLPAATIGSVPDLLAAVGFGGLVASLLGTGYFILVEIAHAFAVMRAS